jgi:hypothetical protein
MGNRRDKLDNSDPFSKRRRAAAVPTLNELTNAMLTPQQQEVAAEAPTSVSIFEVHADPTQPRRAIPAVVRPPRLLLPHEVGPFLDEWRSSLGIDIAPYLANETTVERLEPKAPGEAAFMRIVDLAASIKRDGLVNPITVYKQDDNHYILETGERRWLAYHLLYVHTKDDQWRTIPAQVVDQFSVWRQAGENNARADLNAIGKARQFAILLMDLLREAEQPVQPIDAFEHEQDYYAQVAEHTIPRGRTEIVVTAMGVTNRSVTTRYRNLLKLPHVIWEAADDLDWTERRLRPLTGMSEKDAIATAASWAAQEGYVLPTGNITPPAPVKPQTRLEQFRTRVIPRISRSVGKLKGRERQKAIAELEQLVDELKRTS